MLLASYVRNHCLIQGYEELHLYFLIRFYDFNSYISVFDQFWVIFCIWYELWVQPHSFASGYPAPFVEKTIFPPLNCLSSLVKINLPWMWGFISGLSILFHGSVYPYGSTILSWLLYFVVSFKIGECECSNFAVLSQDYFGSPKSLTCPWLLGSACQFL